MIIFTLLPRFKQKRGIGEMAKGVIEGTHHPALWDTRLWTFRRGVPIRGGVIKRGVAFDTKGTTPFSCGSDSLIPCKSH